MNGSGKVIFDIHTVTVNGDLVGAMILPLIVAASALFIAKWPVYARVIVAAICAIISFSSAWKIIEYEQNRRELIHFLDSNQVETKTGVVMEYVPQKFERGNESFRIGSQEFTYGRNDYKPYFGTTKRKSDDLKIGDILEIDFLRTRAARESIILRIVKKGDHSK